VKYKKSGNNREKCGKTDFIDMDFMFKKGRTMSLNMMIKILGSNIFRL
jgi:hypothetical protein